MQSLARTRRFGFRAYSKSRSRSYSCGRRTTDLTKGGKYNVLTYDYAVHRWPNDGNDDSSRGEVRLNGQTKWIKLDRVDGKQMLELIKRYGLSEIEFRQQMEAILRQQLGKRRSRSMEWVDYTLEKFPYGEYRKASDGREQVRIPLFRPWINVDTYLGRAILKAIREGQHQQTIMETAEGINRLTKKPYKIISPFGQKTSCKRCRRF